MLILPETARSLYVLAHGAGAGMQHHFMESMAQSLAQHQVATLRYNFPYMDAGGKRPDPPAVLHARVRDAIDRGVEAARGLPVIAGGKSMGGRMTSQALAKQHDPRVMGIVFLGFPLHQPGKPSVERAAHLRDVQMPMLFLQGTRDSLAQIDLMREMVADLGERATLHVVDTADHSFAVLKRAGKSKEKVHNELGAVISEWSLAL
jgi:uncharacterized protein